MTLYVAREASKLRRRVMGEISMELQLLAEKFKLLLAGLIAQDILRLLTLWFNHGAASEVPMSLQKRFLHVKIEMCFVVLPQIIAGIHSNYKAVRELIQSLLLRIGKGHPQALMYSLLVACKSITVLRRAAAQEVVDKIRQLSGVLVDQVQLVSKELIRVAILWHETLEEASRLYFGEHNIEGILAVLDPLHAQLEDGPETLKETSFLQEQHNGKQFRQSKILVGKIEQMLGSGQLYATEFNIEQQTKNMYNRFQVM